MRFLRDRARGEFSVLRKSIKTPGHGARIFRIYRMLQRARSSTVGMSLVQGEAEVGQSSLAITEPSCLHLYLSSAASGGGPADFSARSYWHSWPVRSPPLWHGAF